MGIGGPPFETLGKYAPGGVTRYQSWCLSEGCFDFGWMKVVTAFQVRCGEQGGFVLFNPFTKSNR